MKMKAVNLTTISASGGPFLGGGLGPLVPFVSANQYKVVTFIDGSGVFQGDMKDC